MPHTLITSPHITLPVIDILLRIAIATQRDGTISSFAPNINVVGLRNTRLVTLCAYIIAKKLRQFYGVVGGGLLKIDQTPEFVRLNPLVCRGTSNNVKLVHWPLGQWAWAGHYGPTQSPPRCTKCNSPPINGHAPEFVRLNPLVCRGNYNATSNNVKLVYIGR